ncbi:DNA polymerase I, partial [bacterium]|nr:DNA polymerase I [bacterium]
MRDKSLYVIDGHNVLYRAHYAFQHNPLINSKQRDVSVADGFIRMILTMIKDRAPEYMTIAFDRKAPTFRHELYRQYKLNRPPMPAPIADNMEVIHTIIKALGIRIVEQDGFEADDLLASIVERFKDQSLHIYLVSKDKDMLQLVNDKVSVLSTRKGLSDMMEFRSEEVLEKFGILPEQMLDYFAMMGDAVDNIPGISGVGPKTAVNLVNKYGSLEGLYKHADELKGKIGEKIREDKALAFLSRDLVALRFDADLPGELDAYLIRETDRPKLKNIFAELEFHTLIQLLKLEDIKEEICQRRYKTITNRDELLALAKEIRVSGKVALDTETTGLNPLEAKPVGLSLSCVKNEAVYIPIGHSTLEKQANWLEVKEILNPVLQDPTILKIGQNTKYDRHILDRHGMIITGQWFDTMLADYILDAGRRKHDLDTLAQIHLGETKIPTEKIIGKGVKAITMDEVEINTVSEYACEDADVTFRLYAILSQTIKERNLSNLFDKIEMPLAEVLLTMEKTGIGLDCKLLSRLGKELRNSVDSIEDDIWCMAGQEFNINSPKQLQEILFDKLGYPTKNLKKTKSGISTAESELRKLVNQGGLFKEFPEKILEYRTLMKLLGTYIEPLPNMINRQTGRLHTRFNQTGTETGRLSSSEPNLQNIPIRNETGREIRKAFIPSFGNQLLSADYSQMELRILAHIAEDQVMIEAFLEGQDIHASTASKLFGVPIEAVTAEQRRRAKTVNFGIDYGMTPYGLAERLG